MTRNKIIISLFILISILMVACSSSDAGALNTVTPVQAAQMLDTENAIIIDVREQNEWDAQHIPGAIHIPLGDVKVRMTELAQYKDQSIVMQCRSGKRSAVAASILQEAGFEQVSNLTGGIIAWSQAKLPTI